MENLCTFSQNEVIGNRMKGERISIEKEPFVAFFSSIEKQRRIRPRRPFFMSVRKKVWRKTMKSRAHYKVEGAQINLGRETQSTRNLIHYSVKIQRSQIPLNGFKECEDATKSGSEPNAKSSGNTGKGAVRFFRHQFRVCKIWSA
ncbi:hypothetical protein TNCV_3358681 [Trichonephila clavipes]|nr:hypothetical protein TNCV_3358681 [Trichonephila clavipes]